MKKQIVLVLFGILFGIGLTFSFVSFYETRESKSGARMEAQTEAPPERMRPPDVVPEPYHIEEGNL